MMTTQELTERIHNAWSNTPDHAWSFYIHYDEDRWFISENITLEAGVFSMIDLGDTDGTSSRKRAIKKVVEKMLTRITP